MSGFVSPTAPELDELNEFIIIEQQKNHKKENPPLFLWYDNKEGYSAPEEMVVQIDNFLRRICEEELPYREKKLINNFNFSQKLGGSLAKGTAESDFDLDCYLILKPIWPQPENFLIESSLERAKRGDVNDNSASVEQQQIVEDQKSNHYFITQRHPAPQKEWTPQEIIADVHETIMNILHELYYHKNAEKLRSLTQKFTVKIDNPTVVIQLGMKTCEIIPVICLNNNFFVPAPTGSDLPGKTWTTTNNLEEISEVLRMKLPTRKAIQYLKTVIKRNDRTKNIHPGSLLEAAAIHSKEQKNTLTSRVEIASTIIEAIRTGKPIHRIAHGIDNILDSISKEEKKELLRILIQIVAEHTEFLSNSTILS